MIAFAPSDLILLLPKLYIITRKWLLIFSVVSDLNSLNAGVIALHPSAPISFSPMLYI